MSRFIERLKQQAEGRIKKATPKQVEDVLQQQLERDEFRIMEAIYQPDEHDIARKEEGLRRRRHSNRPR